MFVDLMKYGSVFSVVDAPNSTKMVDMMAPESNPSMNIGVRYQCGLVLKSKGLRTEEAVAQSREWLKGGLKIVCSNLILL